MLPHNLISYCSSDVAVEAESSKPDQFGTQLESEGMTCSICMEPWTSTGSHRIW